jgi:hypothetical protein
MDRGSQLMRRSFGFCFYSRVQPAVALVNPAVLPVETAR